LETRDDGRVLVDHNGRCGCLCAGRCRASSLMSATGAARVVR